MPRSGSIIAVSVGFHALTQPTFISGIDYNRLLTLIFAYDLLWFQWVLMGLIINKPINIIYKVF